MNKNGNVFPCFLKWKEMTCKWLMQRLTCVCLMTSCHGNAFRITGPLWGKPPVTFGFSSQRDNNAEFWIFLDVSSNKLLNKQSELQVIWDTVNLTWRHRNSMLQWPGVSHHGHPTSSIPRTRVIGHNVLCLHNRIPHPTCVTHDRNMSLAGFT